MSELRARAGDLVMGESVPYGQRWACKTTWPLTDVLNGSFFLEQRASLHAGDMIRISRFDRRDANDRKTRMLETCEVVVVSSGPASHEVEIAVVGQVIVLGDGAPKAAYEVRRGQAGKFKLMDGENVVQEFGSKAECEAALKQKLAA